MKRIRGVICQVAGPTVVADGMGGIRMNATAQVGRERLLGEVIKIDGELATIQVYEDTAGISLGEEVLSTGKPLTVGKGVWVGVPFGFLLGDHHDEQVLIIRTAIGNRGLAWDFRPP